jgi:hypothetical protein
MYQTKQILNCFNCCVFIINGLKMLMVLKNEAQWLHSISVALSLQTVTLQNHFSHVLNCLFIYLFSLLR